MLTGIYHPIFRAFCITSIYYSLKTTFKSSSFIQSSKISSEVEALRKQLQAAQQREADAQQRELEAQRREQQANC
jgi:hypothetical protein